MSYFNSDSVVAIGEKLEELEPRYNRMLLAFDGARFNSGLAAEFARHGFMRRLGTLKRCIDNIFKLIPTDLDTVPTSDVLHDAQINIQAFFANVYGSIDNLAWIFVCERGMEGKIARNRVGLRSKNKEIRDALSASFQCYLLEVDPWMDYIVEYRDALAHRIPLYIPPGMVPPDSVDSYNDYSKRMADALYVLQDGEAYEMFKDEQAALLVFQPLITHSVSETTKHVVFHAQMLADFLTVEEIGYKMLDELDSRSDLTAMVPPESKTLP